jgi:hypothetical protein
MPSLMVVEDTVLVLYLLYTCSFITFIGTFSNIVKFYSSMYVCT